MTKHKEQSPNAPLNCPKCGVSLLGEKIPDEHAEHYRGTHFKREIGHYDMDRDRTVSYSCPDCKKVIWGDDCE